MAAKSKPVVVAAIGDSLTAGTPYFRSPVEAPPNGLGDAQVPYPAWIAKQHPNWTVLNLGVAGQRSDEIRMRFDPLLSQHPTYAVILAGVNDIYQGYGIEFVQKNLSWMYKQAMINKITPVAVTLPPFDPATAEQSAQIEELNKWIVKQAKTLPMPVVNFHALIADPENPDRLNGTPDGFHPDEGGYRQMGIAIGRLLDSLENAKPR